MTLRAFAAARGRGAFLALLACLGGCAADVGGDYAPIEAKRFWRYGLTATTELTLKTTAKVRRSKYTVLGLDPVIIAGRRYERTQVNGAWLHFFERDSQGLRRVAVQALDESAPAFDAQPRPVLPARLEAGRRWRAPTVTGLLETVVDPFRRQYRLQQVVMLDYEVIAADAAATVPAGRFSACLRVQSRGKTRFRGDKTIFPTDIEVMQTEWYAPGVGLVKSERIETTTTRLLPRGELLTELELYRR